MEVLIRGKKHTFNIDVIGTYSWDGFKSHCEGLEIFQQLPIKLRNAKIKEVYGNIKGDVKETKRPKPVQSLPRGNKRGD